MTLEEVELILLPLQHSNT